MTEHSADTAERMARAYFEAQFPSEQDGTSWAGLTEAARGKHIYHTRAALSALTVEDAAKVLLDFCPNPIFDSLKYPLMGEFSQTECYVDGNGDEDSMVVPIEWFVIKEIIAAALRAIADTPKEGE